MSYIPSKKERVILSILAIMVLVMVFWGGITRLSGSGLSISYWKPITGIIPPISHVQWEQELKIYTKTPEGHLKYPDISLNEFKIVYYIEYFHRMLGRSLFLFLLVIMLFYRYFSKTFISNLIAIFCLICLQGLVGWLMVYSGLIELPHVNHFLLSFHLSLALKIFYLILKSLIPQNNHSTLLKVILISIAIQMFLGGLVAGIEGGFVYNTFPDMNGSFLPEISSPYLNNPGLLQFIHRIGGYLVFILSACYFLGQKNKTSILLLVLVSSQSLIGVLLLIYHTPKLLASAHQVNAFLCFASVMLANKKQAM